jgi:cytochrome c peroxidase
MSQFASAQSLSLVPVPEPPNLGDFIRDRNVALVLGKALFWDMQVGSDGVTACASCHFRAGADGRAKNQISPGLLGGDSTFQTGNPNHVLNIADFPFHELANPDDRFSTVLSESNDVTASQGVFHHNFVGTALGNPTDNGTPVSDPVFNVGGVTTRRVEPRNTPSVINAVFNFSNFLDGRANNIFNGINPFGPSDLENGVFVDNGGIMQEQLVRIINSSLASQAVGPPLSDFEMSFSGRTFAQLGKKMMTLRPLSKQLVHPLDSGLGSFSRATMDSRGRATGQRGLSVTYPELIQAAFQPQFWQNTSQIIKFTNSPEYWHEPDQNNPRGYQYANGIPQVLPHPGRPLAEDEFNQTEANFAFFFGLAVQMYEATLVSDQTRVDRFLTGDGAALSAQEQQGLGIFNDQGRCFDCHAGAEFTNHTVSVIGGAAIPEAVDLESVLNGEQEEPPVQTAATGTATFVINALRSSIVFDLRAQNLVDITGAHIHVGAPGENGPIIFILTNAGFVDRLTGTLTEADFISAGGITTFAQALNAMIAGDTYVNVHTVANPNGEIRGLIEPALVAFEATMDGAQEVPPVTTLGSGIAGFESDVARRTIEFRLDVQNVVNITAAHIHSGLPGENGPIIFVLSATGFVSPPALVGIVGSGDLIPVPGIANFDDVINAMRNSALYVNIHSAANPNGEIRGQILPRPEFPLVPTELMNMAIGRAFYDVGFYNLGVRPTAEDVGRGGSDPFGFPLSFAQLGMMKRDGLLPAELARFVVDLPPGEANPPGRVMRNGAIKVPGLRNVELTAPYFRDGGMATLKQVVSFYSRGGNFREANIDDLDPVIVELNLDETQENALVAFLLALTDDRVRDETFPFDHPQLFVPNGVKGNETTVTGDCNAIGTSGFRQCEQIMQIPAIGQYGRTWAGFPPLRSVVDQFQD